MSGDVTIPREVAREMAAALRGQVGSVDDATARAWADLLDPRPSLRDAVAEALQSAFRQQPAATLAVDLADAALPAVRDHIAALPYLTTDRGDIISRRVVLTLLDGAES
jgi:hypothetical protein